MDHSIASIAQEQHVGGGRKEIWKVTIILTVLTLVELVLGFTMFEMNEGSGRDFVKGVIIIVMLAKAFYIVAYFMHLKHEIKNLVMTIIVPLTLFVWFILAFLGDGNSFRNYKNKWDRGHAERSLEKMPVKTENTHHLE
jgi:cytochrome c oxidase subunit IV